MEDIMNNQNRLSNVTKDYLTKFHCILDNMIEDMSSAELNESISENFIVQMLPHHHAAIEMSENLLRFTTNVSLQDIATSIIAEQTKGMEDMKKVLNSCSRVTNCNEDVCLCQRATNQSMQTMFRSMENIPCMNNINTSYIKEMIPHHLGAIQISRITLQYDIAEDLTPILESIIVSQEQGVKQLQQLLRCGCE